MREGQREWLRVSFAILKSNLFFAIVVAVAAAVYSDRNTYSCSIIPIDCEVGCQRSVGRQPDCGERYSRRPSCIPHAHITRDRVTARPAVRRHTLLLHVSPRPFGFIPCSASVAAWSCAGACQTDRRVQQRDWTDQWAQKRARGCLVGNPGSASPQVIRLYTRASCKLSGS